MSATVPLAKAMGVAGIDGMSVEEAADAAIAAVKQLSADVGIPANLKGYLKRRRYPVPVRERFCRRLPPRQRPAIPAWRKSPHYTRASFELHRKISGLG